MINSNFQPIDLRKTVSQLKNGELTVHSWHPPKPTAIVAYIHGLQSHAAWSWELAQDFALQNAAFVCMDRYSSGLSQGPRNEFPPLERITSDYAALFEDLRERHPNIPILALGHCLGGSILTAVLAERPELLSTIHSISLVSAWLGRMHDSLSVQARHELEKSTNDELWDVGLQPKQFSNSEDYRNFMSTDALALRSLKYRTRKHILHLEKTYTKRPQPFLISNSQFISSYDDPIVERNKAIARYHQHYGTAGCIHLLGGGEHYLPFTRHRRRLTQIIMQSMPSGAP